MKIETDDYMTVTEVVEKLGIARLTVYNRIKRGKLKSIKLWGLVLVEKEGVDDYWDREWAALDSEWE